MQQGRFAQRKLFDDTDKGLRVWRPSLAELDQSGFDLRRVQRCRRFLPNPMIPAIHHAKHHVDLMERPVNARRWITTPEEAPEREGLFVESGIQPDSCWRARRQAPGGHPARSLCAGGESENIQFQERGFRS